MTEEILACFDELGNQIEPQPRNEVIREPRRWWCGAGNVFVVNDKLQLLCSKRSENCANPGKWQARFGGHVKSGHSFKETAQTELVEESGINAEVSALYFVSKSIYEPQKYFHENYLYLYDDSKDNLNIDLNEIVETKWLSFDDYNSALELERNSWTNDCKLEDQEIITKIVNNINQ